MVLKETESESVEIDDGHCVGFSSPLFRCPIWWDADEIIDTVFLILRPSQREQGHPVGCTDQAHALVWVYDLSQKPIDRICHCIQDQRATFGL